MRYGIDDGEGWGPPPKDERRARLHQVAPAGTSFVYQYDFGDCWDHDIEVEDVLPPEAGRRYPISRRRGSLPAGGLRWQVGFRRAP